MRSLWNLGRLDNGDVCALSWCCETITPKSTSCMVAHYTGRLLLGQYSIAVPSNKASKWFNSRTETCATDCAPGVLLIALGAQCGNKELLLAHPAGLQIVGAIVLIRVCLFVFRFQVRTLFVSGLPMDAKPRELYLLFRAYEVS